MVRVSLGLLQDGYFGSGHFGRHYRFIVLRRDYGLGELVPNDGPRCPKNARESNGHHRIGGYQQPFSLQPVHGRSPPTRTTMNKYAGLPIATGMLKSARFLILEVRPSRARSPSNAPGHQAKKQAAPNAVARENWTALGKPGAVLVQEPVASPNWRTLNHLGSSPGRFLSLKHNPSRNESAAKSPTQHCQDPH